VLRTGRGIQQTYTTEYPPNLSLEEIANGSDLIARVVVVQTHPRLTKDETAIESDYTLKIIDHLWARTPNTQPVESVVLTTAGASGSLTIEGYEVTGVDHDLPPFDVDAQYILFMKFDAGTGHYILPNGGQGAFRIKGDPGRESAIQMSQKFGSLEHSTYWNGAPPLFAFIEDLQSALVKEGMLIRVPQVYSKQEGLKK
jgi:hypothetical protein